jgi:hypothetical protein
MAREELNFRHAIEWILKASQKATVRGYDPVISQLSGAVRRIL